MDGGAALHSELSVEAATLHCGQQWAEVGLQHRASRILAVSHQPCSQLDAIGLLGAAAGLPPVRRDHRHVVSIPRMMSAMASTESCGVIATRLIFSASSMNSSTSSSWNRKTDER